MNGILMTLDNHLAIREGRKTVTRRLGGLKEINLEPDKWAVTLWKAIGLPNVTGAFIFEDKQGNKINIKPRYHVGETVYIKEAWATERQYDHLKPGDIPQTAYIHYMSDGIGEWPLALKIGKWRSPLFMPAWAARTFIRILNVQACRTRDITPEDCEAEGIVKVLDTCDKTYPNRFVGYGINDINYPNRYLGATAKFAYFALYDSINGKGAHERNWDFSYEFELTTRPIGDS